MRGDKAIIITLLACVNIAYADYVGRLPSNITLQGGGGESHNAVMDCSNGWECLFGDYAYNFTYSTNGNSDSKLTLIATLPQNTGGATMDKPFYIGTMTINPHSNLTMQGFESFNLGNALHINGGSLSFSNGDFATLFNTNITVTNGGKLGIKGNGFTNKGDMTAQDSAISIFSNTAWNFGNITNNNGNITISTKLHNVGQRGTLAHTFSSVANLINNGGKIEVQGDLHNGGEVVTNIQYQVKAYGGGNITINGGSITIQGQLISEPKDGQNSSIGIYGGTLTTTGGVENKAGSTITIGALNGTMGKIANNVTNAGKIIIDAQGASAGTHQLITGTLNNAQGSISLRNGNTEFATSNLQNTKLEVKLDTDKISSFTSSLDPNQKSTLNALGNQIYTTNGATSSRLTQSADLLEQSAFSAFVSTPFSLISYLKSNLSYPISYASKTSKTNKTNQLEIGFIGAILQSKASSKISGGGGIRVGYAKDFASYLGAMRLEANAGYVYSAIKDFATSTLMSYASSLTSHTAGAEAIFSIPLTRDARLGLKFGLGGFMTFIDSSREVDTRLLWANPSLKSSLSLYQIALNSSVGYEVVRLSNFIATPYLGLHQSVNILPSFAESSEQANTPQNTSIALKTQGYKAYHLGLIVGLEAQVRLKEFGESMERRVSIQEDKKGVLLGRIEYEYLALSSQKSIVFEYPSTDSISLKPPHSHKVRGALGFQKSFTNGVTLGVEASIQSLISIEEALSLYFYGANATVGYRF